MKFNFDGDMLPSLKTRLRFLKLFAMYEDIIYRFSKGGDKHYRDSKRALSPLLKLTNKKTNVRIKNTLKGYYYD